jgi:hypothetical protein
VRSSVLRRVVLCCPPNGQSLADKHEAPNVGRWSSGNEALNGYARPEQSGLPRDLLWHDTDYRLPQQLARFALERGAEGLLLPSGTRLGDILVILPANLKPGAHLRILGSRDPRLYIPRA